MGITLVNITLLKVNGELENFSGTIYPAYTYHKILTNPQLRQKLLAYVLSRMINRYLALTPEKILLNSPESLYYSTREKLELKKLVQQGVVYLILSEINRNSPLSEREVV